MDRLKRRILILSVLLLGGCADITPQQRNTAIGAAVGGVAGSALSDGSTAGTVGGAVAGGLIGSQIKR